MTAVGNAHLDAHLSVLPLTGRVMMSTLLNVPKPRYPYLHIEEIKYMNLPKRTLAGIKGKALY